MRRINRDFLSTPIIFFFVDVSFTSRYDEVFNVNKEHLLKVIIFNFSEISLFFIYHYYFSSIFAFNFFVARFLTIIQSGSV